MYAAALPVAASYWLLWNPPSGLSQVELFAYFFCIAVLVRLFIAVYEIPSASLVPELTDHYDERTTILSARYLFGWWGGLTMSVIAYAIFLQPDAAHPTGVLNPDGYHRYGIVSSIVMLVAILVSAIATHRYIPFLTRPPRVRPQSLRAALGEFRETVTNRSFIALFVAAMFASVAGGLMAALSIYFNTYFWELTSSEIGIVVLPAYVAALLAGVVAAASSRRLGKKWASIGVSTAAIIIVPLPVVLRLVGWFPENRTSMVLPLLMLFNLIGITLLIASNILFSSMVADVAEDSEVATGRRSEGVFTAATLFVQKATSGIGIFASSLLLGAIGFPRNAAPGAVDPEVVRTLGLVYVPLVQGLYVLAGIFLWSYRIDRATHEENLRRLAASREG
jgi:Na+/melibiose symporter-like transporter